MNIRIEKAAALYYTGGNMVKCKRCLILDEQLNVKIQDLLALISPDEKAGAGIYAQRLDTCLSCDCLVSGTCIKCGCFIELRAARSNQSCPAKKW
jgi:hypothetical protein